MSFLPLALLFNGCAAHAPAPSADPRVALEAAVATCEADTDCAASLETVEPLLGSCPWYEAIGCSVVVAAAVAVCVDPLTMEECEPALIAVEAIGCCGCLPKGWVRDACEAI